MPNSTTNSPSSTATGSSSVPTTPGKFSSPTPLPELTKTPLPRIDRERRVSQEDEVHAMPPLKFSDTASNNLKNALKHAASFLEGNIGSRKSAYATASADFAGLYAEDFKNYTDQLTKNAENVVKMLHYGAKLVDYVKECAHVENHNRAKAREWEKRSNLEKAGDWWNDKYSPDYEESPKKPKAPAAASIPPSSVEPQQRSRSVGMEKSSAVPDNLDSYVQTCSSYDQQACTLHHSAIQALKHYQASCKFGYLDLTATLDSFAVLLQQSNQVNFWLAGVGQAFLSAGYRTNLRVTLTNSSLDLWMERRGQGNLKIAKLQVHPAQVVGEVPTSGFANDPVNVATGNFIEPETDLVFSHTASASTLFLSRMYNSMAVTCPEEVPSGVFGLGWSSTLDTCLEIDNKQLSWHHPDGRIILFDRLSEGSTRAAREPWWLTKITPSDAPYTYVQSALKQAYKQAAVAQDNDIIPLSLPHIPFIWMVQNNDHKSHFYTPTGAPIAFRDGHIGTLSVFVLDKDGSVSDLIHPVAHRGIHVTYEHTEDSRSAKRPAAAFAYNTIGPHAGSPVLSVSYSYTNTSENLTPSAIVQPAGLLSGVTTAEGTRTYTYTPESLIHRVINTRGDIEVTNTYDEDGRITAQLSEYGRDISYRYAPNFFTIISDNGTGENENIWVSDSVGRLVSITAADGTRMSMSYDNFGNRVSITERDGSRLVRTSNNRGHIRRERTPEGADYTYTWDEQDRLLSVSVRDARDVKNLGEQIPVASYQYEETPLSELKSFSTVNPNPTHIFNGAGEATTIEYSQNGDILKITDPTGVYTAFEYDEHHDMVTVSNPAGDSIHLTRDSAGRITKVTNPLGATTTLTYNTAGSLSSIVNPLGARWVLQYPKAPVGDGVPYMLQPLQERKSDKHKTQSLLNELNVPSQTSSSVGDLFESIIDPLGNSIRFTYTAGGDIASVTDAAGHTTTHEYDTFGNLAKTVTAAKRAWEYSWDDLSQLIGITDPGGNTTKFEYDTTGELTTITDPTGVISRRSVNRHDGVETVNATDEHTFSSSFLTVDVLGRITAMGPHRTSSQDSPTEVKTTASSAFQDHTGLQMFTYDLAGNITEALDPNGGLTSYTWDAAGRIIRIVSPAGRFTHYTYDECGRLVSESVGLDEPSRITDALTWEEPTRWAKTTLVYDAASQVVERHKPNGLIEHMTYDAAGRLIKVEAGSHNATYTYDTCNRIIRIQDSTFGIRCYTYNALGQLTKVTDGLGYRTFFSYDADGLLASVTDPTGLVTEYKYDVTGRIVEAVQVPHNDAPAKASALRTYFSYDAAGRVTYQSDGIHSRTLEYDSRTGSLARMLVNGALIAEYGVNSSPTGECVSWVKDHTSDDTVMYRQVFDALGNLTEYARTTAKDALNNVEPGTKQALEAFVKTGSYMLSYKYDADGYRTAVITPYGTSRRTLDGVGNPIRSISFETLNDAGEPLISEFSYDVMGNLTQARLADTISQWEFDQEGLVTSYQCNNNDALVDGIQVIRDDNGRIIGLDSTYTGLVMYSYDASGQLIEARKDRYILAWSYEAGLMTSERLYQCAEENTNKETLIGERTFTYNGLNQLVYSTTAERTNTPDDGPIWVTTEVSYTYDVSGRRISQASHDSTGRVQERTYKWSSIGTLAVITDTFTSNSILSGIPNACSRIRVHTDTTGAVTEVIGVDNVSAPLLWDPTAPAPHLFGVGTVPTFGSDGGFSQSAVPGGFDPWTVPGLSKNIGFGSLSIQGIEDSQKLPIPGEYMVPQVPGLPQHPTILELPAGVSFTGSGTLAVGDLALMGERVFEPSSKKFLSQDPLPPILGASWFADSYSFVGNDPIGQVDPWGTRPMSQKAFRNFTKAQYLQPWKTALKIAGYALMVTGAFVAGPAGAMAMSAIGSGVSGFGDGLQLDKNGNVDWGNAWKSAAVDAATDLATGASGKIFSAGKMYLKPAQKAVSKLGSKGRKAADYLENRFGLNKVDYKDPSTLGFHKFGAGRKGIKKYTGEILDGAVSGATSNAIDYYRNADHPSFGGAMGSIALGGVTGTGKAAVGAGVKHKITSHPHFTVGKYVNPAGRGKHGAAVTRVGNDRIRGAQKALVDHMGGRAADALLNPVNAVGQNELIHHGEKGYQQDYLQTIQDKAIDTSPDSFKSLPGSAYKGTKAIRSEEGTVNNIPNGHYPDNWIHKE